MKTTNRLEVMPDNGITLTQLIESIGNVERETVRSVLDRRKVVPLGYIKVFAIRANVFDKKDVEFLYDMKFNEKRETFGNSEIKLFLSTPMSKGVVWNYCK